MSRITHQKVDVNKLPSSLPVSKKIMAYSIFFDSESNIFKLNASKKQLAMLDFAMLMLFHSELRFSRFNSLVKI